MPAIVGYGGLNCKFWFFSDCVDKLVNNVHEQNVQRRQGSIANNVPHLEMKFDSEAAAYEFYNDYSKRIGFGIRREYGNKTRVDGVLTSRRLTCFKEGVRGVDKRRQQKGEPRAEIRTGCLATQSSQVGNGTQHQATIQES